MVLSQVQKHNILNLNIFFSLQIFPQILCKISHYFCRFLRRDLTRVKYFLKKRKEKDMKS